MHQIVESSQRANSQGFALPTVLIVSVVMMIVLLSGLTAATSVSAALRAKHIDRIAKSAAESGNAHAKACIKKDDGQIRWSNASPLKPNTDCTGADLVSCPPSSTDARCYIVMDSSIRSSYEVKLKLDASSTPESLDTKGIVSRLGSAATIISQQESSLKMSLSGLLDDAGANQSLISYPPTGGSAPMIFFGGGAAAESLLSGATNFNCNDIYSISNGITCRGATYTVGGTTGTFSCTNIYSISNGVTCRDATYSVGGTTGTFNCNDIYSISNGITCRGATYTVGGTTGTFSCTNIYSISNGVTCRDATYSVGGTTGTFNCNDIYSISNGITCRGATYTVGGTTGTFSCTNIYSISNGVTCRDATYSVGGGTTSSSGLCGVTDTGQVICAGSGPSPAAYSSSIECRRNTTGVLGTTLSGSATDCATSYSGSYAYNVTNLSTATTSPFYGKTITSLSATTSGLCGVTDTGQVICAGSGPSPAAYSSSIECRRNTTGVLGTTLSGSATDCATSYSGSYAYNVTNLSTATTSPFYGKTITSLSATTSGLCGVTDTGQVICAGSGPSPAAYSSSIECRRNTTGVLGTTLSGSATDCATSYSGSYAYNVTNLSTATTSPFYGKTITSLSATTSGLCGVTDTGQVICAGSGPSPAAYSSSIECRRNTTGVLGTTLSGSATDCATSYSGSYAYNVTNLSTATTSPFYGKTITSLSATTSGLCGVTDTGQVICAGSGPSPAAYSSSIECRRNTTGVLGTTLSGSATDCATSYSGSYAYNVTNLSTATTSPFYGKTITSLSATTSGLCGVTDTGQVICAGSGPSPAAYSSSIECRRNTTGVLGTTLSGSATDCATSYSGSYAYNVTNLSTATTSPFYGKTIGSPVGSGSTTTPFTF